MKTFNEFSDQLDEIFGFGKKKKEAAAAAAAAAAAKEKADMTAKLTHTLHKTTDVINKSENRRKAKESVAFQSVGKEHDRMADHHRDAYRKTGNPAHREAKEAHKEAAEAHHDSAKHGPNRRLPGSRLVTHSHEELAHTSSYAHDASMHAGSDHSSPHADRVHKKFWYN